MRYLLMAAMAAAPVVGLADDVPITTMPLNTATRYLKPPLPNDPLQRMAYQAVVQKIWGDIPEWKATLYKRVLEEGITANKTAKRTTYCPRCSGTTCADGSRVREGICAASRNVPMHAIIWLETDGLLKVTDRGGAVRIPGSGDSAHFDVWRPHCAGSCWTGPGTYRGVHWAIVALP